MGRAPRVDVAGNLYHVLNRSNRRTTIFHKEADYEAFERIAVEAIDRGDIQLFAYCLMPNHWHMVLSPVADGGMARFCQWLTLTHTQRYNVHYEITGQGHLYQGRYKSFPVQGDEHFLTVCRYVERNAYTAELCPSPDAWRWSSLYRWKHGAATDKTFLAPWPIPRRADWCDWVAEPLSDRELKRLHWSVRRGAPFGDKAWSESVARRYKLEMTMRPLGRPQKLPRNPSPPP
jgi:putative transposase